MKKLLHIEWLKLYNYKLAKVFFIIYFVLLFVISIGLYQEFTFFGKAIQLKNQGFYSFPLVYNFLTYSNSFLKIFLAFIVIATVVSEFTNRTFKQNLIDGFSKKEWLVSKITMIFLFCLLSTVIVWALSLIFGYMNPNTANPSVWTEMEFIGFYFLENFSFLMFVFFLCILVRNSIFAFLILFVWKIVEVIITAVLQHFVNLSASPKDVLRGTKEMVDVHVLPLDVQSGMIMNPALRMKLSHMLGVAADYKFPTQSLLLTIFYTVLFIVLSYVILKKRDW